MSGGRGGGSGTIGYKYYFTIHMGLGRGPVDEIVECRVADKLAWQGSVTESGYEEIVQPKLFGGDKKEGGIDGTFKVMMGEPDQVVDDPKLLDILTAGAIPGFRRMVTIVYDGLISAMNPYPKKWAWRVRRAVKGWDGPVFAPEFAQITLGGDPPAPYIPPEVPERPKISDYPSTGVGRITYHLAKSRWDRQMAAYRRAIGMASVAEPNKQILAMNPAHIIFECLTNREWGRGLDRSVIDQDSFVAAAITLYGEGFGMCIRWSRSDTIDAFVQHILDTIGATLYSNRSTALLTLKLIRGNYVRSELPLYTTATGLLEITEATASTNSDALNEVIINYRDPVTNEQRSVRAQNLASLQSANGAFQSKTVTYKGIPTPELAMRVAQRDLRAASEGIRRFKFTMDRRGWKINPGDVIRIEDPLRKIADTVVRVARIEDGTLLNGKITITATQDVFSLPATTFTEQEPDRYTPPNQNPCIGEHKVFEVPYFMLVRTMSAADFQQVTPTSAYVGTVAEQGSPVNASYDIAVRTSQVTPDDWPSGTGTYCGYVPPTP